MNRRGFLITTALGFSSSLFGQEDIRSNLSQIRSDWLSLLGPFPEKVFDLEPTVREVYQDETVVRYHVKFRSEKDDWVTAWLMIPKKPRPEKGKRGTPAILCIHPTTSGSGKDRVAGLAGLKPNSPPDNSDNSRAYGMELAQKGYVTLCMDLLTDGERVSPGLGPYDSRAFYQKHPNWSMVGKNLWDAMRGIDFLTQRKGVDPNRIGCVGHSLGGHSTLFTAAFDKRVKAAVSNGGVYGWMRPKDHWARPGGYVPLIPREKEVAGVGRYTYIKGFAPYLKDPQLPVPVDFDDLMRLVCARALFVSGTRDEFELYGMAPKLNRVSVEYFNAVGMRPSRPDIRLFRHFAYPGAHGFPEEARAQAWRFLDEML